MQDVFDDVIPPTPDWAEFWAAHSRSLPLAFLSIDLREAVGEWRGDLARRIGEGISVGMETEVDSEDEAAPLYSFLSLIHI